MRKNSERSRGKVMGESDRKSSERKQRESNERNNDKK